MSGIEKFDEILKEISTLKAPGVSGSRIKQAVSFAMENVADESKIVALLYSFCKSIPSSHKLGSMYVVDAIVRAYVTAAKENNQTIDSSAPEGTYAAGVFKISELIDSIFDEALELSIIKNDTIKILKLLDIWERAETFDSKIIQNLRAKHIKSTTPPGTPPMKKSAVNVSSRLSTSNADDSTSILQNLAKIAGANSNSNTPNNQNPTPSQPSNDANNILAQLSAISNNNNVTSNAPVKSPPPVANDVFNMLQSLQNNMNHQQQQQQPQQQPQQPQYGMDNGYSRRSRSRSPNRNGMNRRERSPPRNNNQPASLPQIPMRNAAQQFQQQRSPPQQFNQFPGTQNGQFPNQQFQQYPTQQQNQQISPQMSNQQLVNNHQNVPGNPLYRPHNVGFDNSIPQGSIKILSRTLFLGGVPKSMDEAELIRVLKPHAEVQSVILNSERRHAFVKVYSRREAEDVINSFNQDNSLPLRTRWGVGFGPRDCCNYQHGVSVIPLQRLTDADKQWVVQAPWGGTGGQPIQSGMVIDEPDIELGTGPSSKAMSRKMPTNSARNGPKSNRPGDSSDDFARTAMNQRMGPGGQPPFQGNNPLQGLFNNSPNNGQMPQMPQIPTNAGLPAIPNQSGMMPNMANLPNIPQNPNNLSAQLSNFFNQQQQR